MPEPLCVLDEFAFVSNNLSIEATPPRLQSAIINRSKSCRQSGYSTAAVALGALQDCEFRMNPLLEDLILPLTFSWLHWTALPSGPHCLVRGA